jgi:hypothetical protein
VIHHARAFRLTEVYSAEELAGKLTDRDWPLCSGFQLGDYLFLNDTAHADDLQQFAVVKRPETAAAHYRQITNVCFAQGAVAENLRSVERILAGRLDRRGAVVRHQLYLETAAEHELCHYCA